MKSEQTIEQFIKYLYEGISAWEKAGKILAAMVDLNPAVKRRIVEEHPEISLGVLSKLEMVGRGFIRPELLLSDSAPYRSARRLAVSDQRALIENPTVPLVIREEGRTDVLTVDFRNLMPAQVKQVFAEDHVRSEAEQRTWMEAVKRSPMKRDWWIEDGLVVFRKGSRFTVAQLSGIIQSVAEQRAA